MEYGNLSESATPQPTEAHRSAELAAQPAIDTLPEALGLTETNELRQLRSELVEAMSSRAANVKDLATRYHLLAVEIVNQHQGDNFVKAQIGLVVQMALIKRTNDPWAYLESLHDALTYAATMGFADITPTLKAAISEAQNQMGEEAIQ